MLTVVDRPVIQYVVDEAREAGIEHFIFVTGRNKAVIEDHFDIQFELNHTLAQRGKDEQLAKLQRLQPVAGQTSFTRQQEPLGLGHAVWCARELVGDEPFALLAARHDHAVGEELHEGDGGALRADRRQHHRGAGMRSRPRRTNTASSARAAARHSGFEITVMVEKPKPGTAPSNLYINGRYILQPEIFAILEKQERGAGNEIQLTDAMLKLRRSRRSTAITIAAAPSTAARRKVSSRPTSPSRCGGRTCHEDGRGHRGVAGRDQAGRAAHNEADCRVRPRKAAVHRVRRAMRPQGSTAI